MKIRTDFVTNSSSSSFIAIKVKNSRMAEFFELDDAEKLSDYIMDILYAQARASEDGWTQIKDDGEDYETFLPYPFSYKHGSVTEYLLGMIQRGAKEITATQLTDSDFQELELDHREFKDSGFGPFEYIKINKNKKITILIDEVWGPYKGEKIIGMEFYLVGSPDEFGKYERIVEYIESNGGKMTKVLTDRTDYVVCPSVEINSSELDKARENCIPVLSEKAFSSRYLGDNVYDDVSDVVYKEWETVFFSESVLWMFETYGVGEVTVEYWKDGKWVKPKRGKR